MYKSNKKHNRNDIGQKPLEETSLNTTKDLVSTLPKNYEAMQAIIQSKNRSNGKSNGKNVLKKYVQQATKNNVYEEAKAIDNELQKSFRSSNKGTSEEEVSTYNQNTIKSKSPKANKTANLNNTMNKSPKANQIS